MDRQLGSSGPLQNNWLSSSTPMSLGKISPGHGVNDLSAKIKAELNRSIAKHMEKGTHTWSRSGELVIGADLGLVRIF